ncbi:MAG TPA: succinylglutamate desuccinylase/aspartoacylase family protein [Kofleriaceae bacterium]|nr:succinylglutamate desuccinylase/aspartoacylase family protein [Kofleriaceae bacterium]
MRIRLLLVLIVHLTFVREGDASRPWRGRPTGSKYGATRAAQKRNRVGGRQQQPRIGAPEGLRPLTASQIDRATARLVARRPDVAPRAIAAGYERYRTVVARTRAAGRRWPDAVRVRRAGRAHGMSIMRVDLTATSAPAARRPRVLIVGGQHAGNERVGIEAALRFIESAAADDTLRSQFDITVVPLLTPSALVLGDRENIDGANTNRTFVDGKWTAESKVLKDMIDTEGFDLVLDLHGAGDEGRNGFFVIGQGHDGGMTSRILSAMESPALMDVRGAGGRPAIVGPYSMSHLGDAVSANPDTLPDYADARGVKYAYTVEAPTRMDATKQVRGMLKLVGSALQNVRRHGDWR